MGTLDPEIREGKKKELQVASLETVRRVTCPVMNAHPPISVNVVSFFLFLF